MANQVDFKILPSDQFSVYSPSTRSDKIITYFTLLSKLRGDILAVSSEEDPNNIVSAYYSTAGGVQTLHLVKADGSEVTASQSEQIISGTINYVSKFTSSNDIGDSQIFDDGTNVGIGTTTMAHKLQLGTGGVFADYFQLDTTYSNGFVVGAISWDIDNGTADLGLSGSLKLKIGQDDVWYVKNQTGSTINKGTAVYASGTLGASSKILISPMIANGSVPARFFLGIVAENIANGGEGYVLTKGKLRNINTNAYNEGDVLWVSPSVAGALTATEPTAPNLKLPVAFVVNKGNNGVLAVRATTGVRIADASDVDYTGAADNSFLVYNSSTGVWEDETIGIFKTIAVSGQSDVVADNYTDTLTLVAGTNVTITTNATTDSITINATDQYVGTVTSVATTAPITGGTITTTGTIGITQSGAASDGYLSSTDWNTFNSKEPALTKGNLTETTSSVLTITGGTNAVIGTGTTIAVSQAGASSSGYLSSTDWNTFNNKQNALTFTSPLVNTSGTVTINQSGTASDGYLSSTDWNTFNSKEPALTKGNLTEVTSAVLTITGGTGAVIGTGTSIQVSQATSTTSGYLSSTDWNTFNSKSGAAFKTISVAGQSDIVADAADDTLTIAAGTGVTLTTNATTDTLTITNAAPDQTVVLTAGTGITTSGTYPNFTITNSAPDQVVSLTGAGTTVVTGTYPSFTITSNDQYVGTVTSVDLTAGTGISVSGGPITTSGSITVNNTDTGSAQNIFKNIAVTGQSTIVADNNDDTLNVVAGTGVTITTNATTDTLTISATGTGGTVTSVDLTAGTGISVSGGPITSSGSITVTNNDRGSSQNIFKNINVTTTEDWNASAGVWDVNDGSWSSGIDQDAIVADSNNDTLYIESISGISITTDASTDSMFFENIDKGSSQNIFKNIAVSGQSTIVADDNDDTLTVVAGTGVTITTNATTDTLTISATGSGGTVTSIATTAPITGGPITSAGTIGITQSSSTTDGYLSSTDWSTFNGKTGLAFKTISVTGQTDIVADVAEDTLNVAAGTGISLTTTALSDTLTITNNDLGSSQDIFKTIAVSGQTNIVADSNNDTLTFAAGTGISITTNATTDTVTITNTAVTSIDCFAAYTSQNLSLAVSGTEYYIEFDNVSISDTSVFSHSTTTNPENITVLEAGRYEISFGFFAVNGNNQIATVQGYISINNVAVSSFSFLQLNTATVGQYVSSALSTYIYDLDDNDVINATTYPEYVGGSTGTITINPSGYDGSTYITIKKIG